METENEKKMKSEMRKKMERDLRPALTCGFCSTEVKNGSCKCGKLVTVAKTMPLHELIELMIKGRKPVKAKKDAKDFLKNMFERMKEKDRCKDVDKAMTSILKMAQKDLVFMRGSNLVLSFDRDMVTGFLPEKGIRKTIDWLASGRVAGYRVKNDRAVFYPYGERGYLEITDLKA